MTEDDKTYAGTLLPAAQVTLFTEDAKTKKTFESLTKDWRFARVDMVVQDGSVEAAIKFYESYQSPDLIIVQTDVIDGSLPMQLEELAGHCSEGTSAIVIGPDNDVNLYRKLVGMGVSDYLVKPVKAEAFGNDIAATLIDKKGESGSRLITLLGAKGGVGTTVLSEAMAWGVSERLNQKTFLLDAAGGWSTLGVGMNFEPSTTIIEAARAASEGNQDSITRMIHSASDKLSVLSSGGDVMLDETVSGDEYEALIDFLMARYPVVIVDLSGSSAALKRTVLTRAHEIMLITTPVLPCIRASRTLIQEISELRGGTSDAIDLVLNMQGYALKHEVPKSQIEEGLDRKIDASIPFDSGLFVRTESEARKLDETKTGSENVDKLLPLIKKVLTLSGTETAVENTDKDSKGLGGFFSKLKAK